MDVPSRDTPLKVMQRVKGLWFVVELGGGEKVNRKGEGGGRVLEGERGGL